jgi:hypothetical protein
VLIVPSCVHARVADAPKDGSERLVMRVAQLAVAQPVEPPTLISSRKSAFAPLMSAAAPRPTRSTTSVLLVNAVTFCSTAVTMTVTPATGEDTELKSRRNTVLPDDVASAGAADVDVTSTVLVKDGPS